MTVMRKRTIVIGAVVSAHLLGTSAAFAGPWEDGMAAYNRGDYVPAMRLFRALAEGLPLKVHRRDFHSIGLPWLATRVARSRRRLKGFASGWRWGR